MRTLSPIAQNQERRKITGGIMAGDVDVHTSRQTYTITTKNQNVQNEYKFISFLNLWISN